MYMNDQQQEQYNSKKKDIDDIKTSLKSLPDSMKASIGYQLESQISVLNREIRTLIDDTHKVILLLLLLLSYLSNQLLYLSNQLLSI